MDTKKEKNVPSLVKTESLESCELLKIGGSLYFHIPAYLCKSNSLQAGHIIELLEVKQGILLKLPEKPEIPDLGDI